ncbi:MAG TPA: L-glyceraldehyde 3-phosphate reductase [Sedimentisphaerales bacterium]|nr:L-glyceraldehyde 3-phosphate reductase [Sedimentisphaerales bacterium]
MNNKDKYDQMKYNRCGQSGILLPAVSLGLWHNFGGVDTLENSRAMAITAFNLGITHFDLANNYGPPPGSAEENFGQILKKDLANHRDELIISTKAGYLMWPGPYGKGGSKKYLLASLDQSLKRMGLEYVDIFYSHCPDPQTPIEETMDALTHAIRQGKAIYAGISSYSADQTQKASDILNQMQTHCLIHQPSYSMLNRWPEDGLLDVLEKQGIGCITFCPLAQGLLTDKYLNGIPADSRAAKPHGFLTSDKITSDLLKKITLLNNLAKNRGQSLAQMALAWILKDSRITSVLIGASNPRQIEENVKTLNNLNFTKEELTAIDEILK